MAASRRQPEPPVPGALREILESAAAAGAESVELEYVPEGVEICVMAAGTGIGRVVGREVGRVVIDFIVRAAGLGRRERGVLEIHLAGQPYTLRLENYEHFGEWAYRIIFPRGRQRRRA